MTGTHASNKDQTPNLLNHLEADKICFVLNGNHFF